MSADGPVTAPSLTEGNAWFKTLLAGIPDVLLIKS